MSSPKLLPRPLNLGKTINSGKGEHCPIFTPGGKYFMFTHNGQIYWVNTRIFAKYGIN